MKAAFLDRDGIINVERGDYTWLVEHFKFTHGLFPFLRNLREKGYELIVITNQGGINKGLYEKEDVEYLHEYMKKELEKEGIDLLDVYYCPHHDKFQKCLCRKPGSQMIEKAIAVHGIDPASSFMIGDKQRDADAGERAGVKGIVVEPNPDWSAVNIEDLL